MTDSKPKKPVILYVDDDPDYLDAMQQLLEAHGYDMLAAQSGEDGFRVFKQSKPDLILLDLMMEEVDAGTNLLRELRAEGNKAPVYLISSVGETMTTMTSATDLGFTGVFQKPMDNKKLLAVLDAKLKQQA